jgi:HsdM N-terminal domain
MALKKSELYSSLWASCDELRGGMDASQYKDYVLVLLFDHHPDRYRRGHLFETGHFHLLQKPGIFTCQGQVKKGPRPQSLQFVPCFPVLPQSPLRPSITANQTALRL